ncbi:hypothetical protein [Labilithrix luteola]|nr:hypothetical protein [Labilithrix luteola]
MNTDKGTGAASWNGKNVFVWEELGKSGAVYSPDMDTWDPVSDSGGPFDVIGRTQLGILAPSIIWVDEHRAIFWGGMGCGDSLSASCDEAYIYDRLSKSWSKISSIAPVPGRTDHTAIWTGTKMLVWGGDQWFDSVHGEQRTDGASYDPVSNEWEVMTNAGAPAQRDAHTSIWTGTVMIVWGGRQWRGGGVPAFLADGGIYEPATDSWRPISSIGAPSERGWHSAVWTGTEMLVWGGLSTTSDGSGHVETHQDGFAYDPVLDRWRPLSMVGAPSKRTEHSAVWTGTNMIVWGGFGEGDRADGGIYDPKTDTWQRMESAPFGRGEHFAFWTGSRMLVYGGQTTESDFGFANGSFFTP